MNSTYRGHVLNEVMYVEVNDLEAGPPPLVGDSYGQPLQKTRFQEKHSEDLSVPQTRVILVWLLVASAINVIVFDKAVTNAKIKASFCFITAGNFIILGALLEKYFGNNNRALYLLRLSSWALLGALGRFLVKV
jgi:hypothetical protein